MSTTQGKTPLNSASRSDEQYWFLREVQHLVRVPMFEPVALSSKTGSVLRSLNIVDLSNGKNIIVGDIAKLPSAEAIAVMDADGTCIHILQGKHFTHSLKIDCDALPARAICADDTYLFVLSTCAQLSRISLIPLLERVAHSLPFSQVSLKQIAHSSISLTPRITAQTSLVQLASLGSRGLESKVLLCARTFDELCIAMWTTSLTFYTLLENAQAPLAESIEVGSACAASQSGVAYLTDINRGRVLRLDLSQPKRLLKVIAGEGVLQIDGPPRFGSAMTARLGGLTGICQYGMSEAFAQQTSMVVVPVNPEEWRRRRFAVVNQKLPKSAMDLVTSQVSVKHAELAKCLRFEGKFLAATDKKSGVAMSISLPERTDGTRSLWPILPPVVGATNPKITKARVSPGTDSSLVFWECGDPELLVYAPDTNLIGAQASEAKATQIIQNMSKKGLWPNS